MERRGDGEGAGWAHAYITRPLMYTERTVHAHNCPRSSHDSLWWWWRGKKELLLELVHVRLFGRREFVYKRVKETKGGDG